MTNEASIFINGVKLFEAQSMVIRIALEVFISELKENGLGDDEHGKHMVKAYLDRIDEVRRIIYTTPKGWSGNVEARSKIYNEDE